MNPGCLFLLKPSLLYVCHLLGKASFATDLFKYAELRAHPGPTECTEPSAGIEAWYIVCFRITLCGFVIVCLALMFTCIRTFLESKLWENRYVFGMRLLCLTPVYPTPRWSLWLTPYVQPFLWSQSWLSFAPCQGLVKGWMWPKLGEPLGSVCF